MTRYEALERLMPVEIDLVRIHGGFVGEWPAEVVGHYRAFDYQEPLGFEYTEPQTQQEYDEENARRGRFWHDQMTPQLHRHLFWLENQ